MNSRRILGLIAVLGTVPLALGAQQPIFGTAPPDTTRSERRATAHKNVNPATAAVTSIPGFGGADSVVFRLLPRSRLEVKTGKAGLFGFAGHSHVIRARAFSGRVVLYPKAVPSSHVEIVVPANSLEVVTPPDTAEIRKVTATMRSEVLHVDQHHEITLVSKSVRPTPGGFQLLAALTLVGQTRDVPVDVSVEIGPDTLRARATFSVKQTEFGIKPYSGGPGGTVKVADRVTFDLDAIAVREKASTQGAE